MVSFSEVSNGMSWSWGWVIVSLSLLAARTWALNSSAEQSFGVMLETVIKLLVNEFEQFFSISEEKKTLGKSKKCSWPIAFDG